MRGSVAGEAAPKPYLVTAGAIFANGNAAERQHIQNEVDGLLQRIVKKKRAAQQTAAIANRDRAKLLNGWRATQNKTANSYIIEITI